MSKFIKALINKNTLEKKYKQRKQEEVADLRMESAYRAKLHDELKIIDILLDNERIKTINIKIPKEHITKFTRALYSEELVPYNIIQIDEYTFKIGRKIINF